MLQVSTTQVGPHRRPLIVILHHIKMYDLYSLKRALDKFFPDYHLNEVNKQHNPTLCWNIIKTLPVHLLLSKKSNNKSFNIYNIFIYNIFKKKMLTSTNEKQIL